MAVEGKAYKAGDWIDAMEGIARVLSVRDLYVEPFCLSAIREGKAIGDLDHTMVIYKLLCDFDGKLRKKDIVRCANMRLCTPASAESSRLAESIKSKEPRFFEKFLHYRYEDRPKPLGGIFNLELDLGDAAAAGRFRDAVKEFSASQAGRFTFDVIRDYFREIGFDILALMRKAESPERKVILQLFNESYLTDERRRLFSSAQVLG